MKYLPYLIIIIFFSCSNEAKPKAKREVEIKKESKYSALLEKFENISFDTLKVISEGNFKKFKGRELDSLDIVLFPKEISEAHFFYPTGIFACYKFSIDSSRIGLITRTPSEFLSSSIKLFVFDIEKQVFSNYIELAERWGDAGDALEKTSFLFEDKQNKIQSLIWVQERHYNSAEDENDTTYESWDYHYLIDISSPFFDTINNNSKFLSKKYKSLLKVN